MFAMNDGYAQYASQLATAAGQAFVSEEAAAGLSQLFPAARKLGCEHASVCSTVSTTAKCMPTFLCESTACQPFREVVLTGIEDRASAMTLIDSTIKPLL